MKLMFSPTSATLASDTAGEPPLGLFQTVLSVLRRWAERRAVLAVLSRLDRATLDDLRIYPGDFLSIADGTYARVSRASDAEAPKPASPSLATPRVWPL